MTTAKANELAREALIEIIVARMRKSASRRFGECMSPNAIWRNLHRQ